MSQYRIIMGMISINMGVTIAVAQDAVTQQHFQLDRFLIASSKEDLASRLAGWTTYNIMHVEFDKTRKEWSASRPTAPIHVFQCVATTEVQQTNAREFAKYAQIYSYWAFANTSQQKPEKDDLLWPELNNPFINHLREMRKLVGKTPIVAFLQPSAGSRACLLEEVQWQLIACLGANYRGVVWPASQDLVWLDAFKRLEERIKKYSHSLADSKPVNWSTAQQDQPISAAASGNMLFVFLLNPAYMNLDIDNRTVTAPLSRPVCEGYVITTVPPELIVQRAETLEGKALNLVSEEGQIRIHFSFKTGGDMLILSLLRK